MEGLKNPKDRDLKICFHSRMELIEEHYQKLLELGSSWNVESVTFSAQLKQVDIEINYTDENGCCPKCDQLCSIYDHQSCRTWRHLDTMQFSTVLHSTTPRTQCPDHGVLNIKVPWAEKHSRFTLLFEAFSIEVLRASRSVEEARKLLRINWHQIEAIKKRAVERGLLRRTVEEVPWLGVDEKSFRRGHKYISLLNDLEEGRVIDVVEGRDGNASNALLTKGLTPWQRSMVCGVAMDMWPAYIKAATELLPHADIVHDRFHISKYLNDAVDKVRRQEHRVLQAKKEDTLKGTKYLWLKGMERFSEEERKSFEALRNSGMSVAKAWEVKELFVYFWSRRGRESATRFFENWFEEAMKTGLTPIKKVAKMIKVHLSNLLTYFESYISNAVSEGLNSKIQTIKANARGYRSFESFRISILFYCGRLNMTP